MTEFGRKAHRFSETGGRGAGVVGSFGIGGVIAAVPAVAGK